MDEIKDNLVKIRDLINKACDKVQRNPEEVTLVAVTKTLPGDIIKIAYDCGVKLVGENKVQELVDKKEQLADLPISWHFIGHLQTNKVKFIVDKVAMIHSVDRLKLAGEISRECEKKNTTADILVQVNISGENSKFGVQADEAIKLISAIAQLKHINVKGLMTMAPYTENPEEVRYVFAGLKELAEKVRQEKNPGVEMKELSMGMTNDFQVAIEEGATLIRVGSGIFGERQYN